MYGRPKTEDCASTYLAMPDAKSSISTDKLSTFRRFVEPQQLEPPFAAILNDFGAEMEQILKFWRYSKFDYVFAFSKSSIITSGWI